MLGIDLDCPVDLGFQRGDDLAAHIIEQHQPADGAHPVGASARKGRAVRPFSAAWPPGSNMLVLAEVADHVGGVKGPQVNKLTSVERLLALWYLLGGRVKDGELEDVQVFVSVVAAEEPLQATHHRLTGATQANDDGGAIRGL